MGKPTSSMCVFSSTQLRRLELAERVWRLSAEERGEVGYLARAFVVVNLPLRDPGNVPVWSRINGDAALTVQQGYFRHGNSVSPLGYPFGATARWLLIAVFTEAVRRQSPEIDLGDSVTAFLRQLGVSTDGRRLRAVHEQLARLLAASIRFTFRDDQLIAGANRSIASDYLLWRRQSGTRARGFTVLNEAVFRDLIQHPIPLDLGAIRALRDCPLSIDLFVFFSFRLRAQTRPLRMCWVGLQAQLGADYSAVKEFARHARFALRRVHSVWPSLRTEFFRGGVIFFPPDSLPVKRLDR